MRNHKLLAHTQVCPEELGEIAAGGATTGFSLNGASAIPMNLANCRVNQDHINIPRSGASSIIPRIRHFFKH